MNGITDSIIKNITEGFAYNDMSTTKIAVTLIIAFVLAMYVHMVYKLVTRNAFYYKNFGIAMTLMAVITAGIIMAMQSSLVISLGMVGALSIIRFRTAIKDPMDLMFLFWSISIGIICGAGLYEMAIIMSVVTTAGIVSFKLLPAKKNTVVLVVNAASKDVYADIMKKFKAKSVPVVIKAKNVSKKGMELIIEAKLNAEKETIVDELMGVTDVEAVYLLENDMEIKQ